MRLWHGSNQKFDLFDVKEHSEVGMIVATPDKYAAETYGKYLYYLDVHEEKILDTDMLLNEIDINKTKQSISNVLSSKKDKELEQTIFRFITRDSSKIESYAKCRKHLSGFDYATLLWIYVSTRCGVARDLGYPVVTVEDGKEISYMILPGQCLERYLEDA